MSSKFDRAFEAVIGHEGGLSLDRGDPGNWTGGAVGAGVLKGTKYGISAASYPNEDIRNLTLDRAREIYERDYWGPCRAEELPYRVGFNLFDGAVNSGVRSSVQWLQRALGVSDDGIFGPVTMEAAKRGGRLLAQRYNAHRLLYLTELGNWDRYSEGWSKRVARNLLV